MAVDGSRALAELDLNSSIGYFCSDPVTFGLRPRKPLNSHIYREKEPSAIRLHIAPVILPTPASGSTGLCHFDMSVSRSDALQTPRGTSCGV